jgi:hypothetical protein
LIERHVLYGAFSGAKDLSPIYWVPETGISFL